MLSFKLKAFSELSLQEFYALAQLRQAVFVVEQNCPYLDLDGKDQLGHHLLGLDAQGELQAYARILAAGSSYPQDASIGRVISSAKIRGKGQGPALMQAAISACQKLYPQTAIRISAQSHLVHFYARLGFQSTGKEYLEDDIPHTEMLLEFKTL